MEICQDSLGLLELGQKYQALHMKSSLRFTIPGDFKSQ